MNESLSPCQVGDRLKQSHPLGPAGRQLTNWRLEVTKPMPGDYVHNGRWTCKADAVWQERCTACRFRGATLVDGKCSQCYPAGFPPLPG